MAPVDRREHRQQRVRGAGPSAVQASFGFNFGALDAAPAKQSSLPTQRSSRRTPVAKTPHGTSGSARRHRSVSVQRSSGVKRKSTPSDRTVTPRLGKRKRGSTQAQTGIDDSDLDELSPNRDENVPSIEKSRKHTQAPLPVHGNLDDGPDELSILEEVPDELSIVEEDATMSQKSVLSASVFTNVTPVSRLVKRPTSLGSVAQETLMADLSRQSISRRSKSLDPTTPRLLLIGQPRQASAARRAADFNTPATAPAEEESEDELSPSHVSGTTLISSAKRLEHNLAAQQEDEIDMDELSPPVQPPTAKTPLGAEMTIGKSVAESARLNRSVTAPSRARPGRIRQAAVADVDSSATNSAIVRPSKRGRPRKAAVVKEADAQMTPVALRSNTTTTMESNADVELDELSPESGRAARRAGISARHEEAVVVSRNAEATDEYEESQPELNGEMDSTSQPGTQRQRPKQVQRTKTSTEKVARKRQKLTGPKHAFSVMRIKGSSVRGITVADTARTILEKAIDHRLERAVVKLQTLQDSARRKELRGNINLTLSFKESLGEKLLDLQDANDVLSVNFKKMKVFRRDNAGLRKEILALQNNRQEVALEHDDVQAEFEAEKLRTDARNTLSADMFDIEAAIQNGRERAREESRQNEGPVIPLSMILENVSKAVGSSGGGLLSSLKGFNGLLENAAGLLEGRA